MAITIKGAGIGNVNNTTGVTVSPNTAIAEGDFLLFMMGGDGAASNMVPPGSVTHIRSTDFGAAACMGAWYRFAGPSEATSFDFGWVSGERAAGGLLVCSGVSTSTAVDTSNQNIAASDDNTGVFTSLTPNSSDCLVVTAIATDEGQNGAAFLSSWPPTITEYGDLGALGSGTGSGGLGFGAVVQSLAAAVSSNVTIANDVTSWMTFVMSFFPAPTNPNPTITAVGDSGIIFDGELNVAISGTELGSSAGRVYLSQTSSLGATNTYLELSIDSYSSTAVQIDVVGLGSTPVHDIMALFSTYYIICERPGTTQSTGFPITITSSAQAAVNTNSTLDVGVTYIYVPRIESSGALSSTAFRYEVNHNNNGYIAVTTGSSYISAVPTTAFPNDADISEVIGSTELFNYVQNNNAGSHDGTFELSTGLISAEAMNGALAFQINSAHVADGETGLIRVTLAASTTLNVYDSTFVYEVQEGAPAIILGHGMLLSDVRNKLVI